MTRIFSLLIGCVILIGIADRGFAQNTSFRISFTGRDTHTGTPVMLDSVWVLDLSASSDTTLFAPFILEIGSATGIGDRLPTAPGTLEISANFANPFADETRFRIECARPAGLEVALYSVVGARIAWLERDVPRGSHEFIIHGRALAAGAYFLTVSDGRTSRSVSLVKVGLQGEGVATIAYSGTRFDAPRNAPRDVRPATLPIRGPYRCTGFAAGYSPATVEAAPVADTTVRFEFVRIPSAPSIINFSADAYSTGTGLPVRFEVHASDADGDLAQVLIDFDGNGVFDDSTAVTGGDVDTAFTSVFTAPGSFVAKARVVDGRGLMCERSLAAPVIVTLTNTAPTIASFVADFYTRKTGDSVRYSVSSKDDDANLAQVWIDFDGNGVYDDSGAVSGGDIVTSFAKLCTTPGSFLAKARVMDARGLTCERNLVSPVIVTPANTPPTITSFVADSSVRQTGDPVRYTIASKDADANLAKVWIDFDGNGVFDDSASIAGGNTVTVFPTQFTTPGSFVAKARVMDAQGLTCERSLAKPVIVAWPPPAISGCTPSPVCIGGEVTISGAHFGAVRGAGTVHFKGGDVGTGTDYLVAGAVYVSWSDTLIILHAPAGITDAGVVYVTATALKSNVFPFQLAATPSLTTNGITQITFETATCGGVVTSDGGCSVTARGVCWSTNPEPTIADDTTTNGAGIGGFTINMTGLDFNTTYYVRAYATNSTGTGYGDEVMFTTIGQIWMTKNLDVSTYRNGDPIPEVTDPAVWASLTTGAWCYYNNDPAMGAIYGKFYNWYAVNDPRGLAPIGWHMPDDGEWMILEMTLGMSSLQTYITGWRGNDEGGKLKEQGTAHWTAPNVGATNSSGFTALGGGHRLGNGAFSSLGQHSYWWTSSEYDSLHAWFRCVQYSSPLMWRAAGFDKDYGFFVRCVKD